MKNARSLYILLAFTMLVCCLAGCHEHAFSDATCTEPAACECGETEGEPLGHKWVDATCEKPKTCSACGETEGAALGHKWVDATCTAAKTCSVCSKTDGEPLGHELSAATHLARAKCSVCGEEVGDLLPYAEEFGFNFTTDRDYSAPYFAFLGDANGNDKTEEMNKLGFSTEHGPSNFHIDGAEASAPDENGNVTITASYTIDLSVPIHYDTSKRGGSPYSYWRFPILDAFDYYSGCTMPVGFGTVGDDKANSVELTYDGKTIPVSISVNSEVLSNDVTDWSAQENGVQTAYFIQTYKYTTLVTVPQDYDGLCLSLYKPGATGPDGSEDPAASAPLLDGDDGETYSADDFYFIRVKDLIG